jgi:hypothetical protein
LYLYITRALKQILVVTEACHFAICVQNFIQHPTIKVNSYAEEIIGDHQCGFRRNRSTIDHIFCIREILEKNGNTLKQCISSLCISRKL